MCTLYTALDTSSNHRKPLLMNWHLKDNFFHTDKSMKQNMMTTACLCFLTECQLHALLAVCENVLSLCPAAGEMNCSWHSCVLWCIHSNLNCLRLQQIKHLVQFLSSHSWYPWCYTGKIYIRGLYSPLVIWNDNPISVWKHFHSHITEHWLQWLVYFAIL